MSSFHDQIFSEIDAARKMAADFATRHGRSPAKAPRMPSGADRLAQEEAAAAEIAALVAEEKRLASQARERAERRAKLQAEEVGKARNSSPAPGRRESRWHATAILKGLAKLRIKERSAAEELIRKAHKVHHDARPGATDHGPDGRERRAELPAAPVRGMWTPSLGATQVWYFTSLGTRCGPVTFAELRTMAGSRVLDPRLDMVWKEGMEGWKQAGLLDGLFERRNAPAETPEKRGGKRPPLVAALPKDLTAALASKQMHWPGIGRVRLWLGLLLLPLLWSELLRWISPTLVGTFGSAWMSKLLPSSNLVPIAISVHLLLRRLVNVGMSRWWALVLAIPVLNIWVAFRCFICPAGYAHHRQMDRSGIATTLAVLLILPAWIFLHLKQPGLLTPEQLQTTMRRMVEGLGKMISSP